MIKEYEGKRPLISTDVFIAENAVVLGDVRLEANSSVWYNAVIRGDVHSIHIGKGTNIQDGTVVHVTSAEFPTFIGDNVTVGHTAIIHGCKIGNRTLVGMGAIVLDGVEVGEDCVIAAGAVLPPGKKYPNNSLIIGSPAQVKRAITADEKQWIAQSAEIYMGLARKHMPLVGKNL